MRVKHVPEPPSEIASVATAQQAVPLVPESETDCCARLMSRFSPSSRDEARTWLTFLRGLGLVENTDAGYRRTRGDPTVDRLRTGLLEGIFGARELARALIAADRPLSNHQAFTAVRDHVPQWERYRTGDWESVWVGRIDRLLGWFDLVGFTTRCDAGYVSTGLLGSHLNNNSGTRI